MLDRHDRVDVVASQAHGVRAELGLTRDQTASAVWTVAGETRVSGPRAVGLMIAVAWNTRLPLLVWKLPIVPAALDRLYAVIARNRMRFPGDTPWCVSHPDACEEPSD